MKNFILISLGLIATLFFSACNKDVQPVMTFKTGADYISKDLEMARHNQEYKVGVIASRASTDYALANFVISRAYDDEPALEVQKELVVGGESYSFKRDYTVKLRNQVGKEVWYFKMTDRDGETKTLSIKFNVQ
jgi:hypothetical protein